MEHTTVPGGNPTPFPRRRLFGALAIPFAGRPPGPPEPPAATFAVPVLEPPDPLAVLAERYAGLFPRLREARAEFDRVFQSGKLHESADDRDAPWAFYCRTVGAVCDALRDAEHELQEAMERAGVPLFVAAGRLYLPNDFVGEDMEDFAAYRMALLDVAALGGNGGGR